MDDLTTEQASAVAQIRDLVAGDTDDDVLISVLQTTDWDVSVRLPAFTAD